ncbi:MAG: leucyl aminopeptidase [Ignavibacterium sp.]|nr:leucyl aminopeptidase [Ignavibacterium sp.]MDW8376272.1 leucyl aminopeptidase [Ignavibacteriales bacterium]
MFDLKFHSGKKKITYNQLSLAVRFIYDDNKIIKNLEHLEKIYYFNLSNLQKENFSSDNQTQIRIPTKAGKPDEILIKKIKINEKLNADFFRSYFAELINQIKTESLKSIHIFLPDFKPIEKIFEEEAYYIQTVIEGIFLGNYTFDKYKTSEKPKRTIDIYIHYENEKLTEKVIKETSLLMKSVYFARDLQNEPSNFLTPEVFAKILVDQAKKRKIKVTVFDEKEIEKRKMYGLFYVGKGSINKPRFVVLEYKSPIKKNKKNKLKKIALVGKGMTFDSGGISLKPSKSMGEMKNDMAGASVVAASVFAAADNKLPIHLYGIIPLAENMPSGSAFKPGDVIKTSSGKTIEVEDTDAEGRIILSDALHYASNLNPDQIIDYATLTGSVVVALGEFVAGMFTKNDEMANLLYKAGIKTFERVWQLPLWDDYFKMIESDIADVKNLGSRWAGSITAAKFLEMFVDKNIPWTHLDIAGPSMRHNNFAYTSKYMTGFGIRLTYEYLKSIIKN